MTKVYPKIFSIDNLLPAAISDILDAKKNKGIKGLKTGIESLDLSLSGLQKGQLIVIGGRPRLGKSSMAHNIIINVAEQNIPVALFSLEMKCSSVIQRIISTKYEFDNAILRSGCLSEKELTNLNKWKEELSKLPIYISDFPYASLDFIDDGIKTIKNIGLVIIDYLTLLQEIDVTNPVHSIGRVTRELKLMAMKYEIPIILISQLSRACTLRPPYKPSLESLRDSGNIENDADVVLLLHREVIYNPNCPNPEEAILSIAKQRDGSSGDLRLRFIEKYMKFSDKLGGKKKESFFEEE